MLDGQRYLEELLAPIRACRNHLPEFSLGEGSIVHSCSYQDYQMLFRIDPFAGWLGLESARMYSAHRTASAITRLHHQIRIGCARLLRAVFCDCAEYENSRDGGWRYKVKTKSGAFKSINMDARLYLDKMRNQRVRSNVRSWITAYCRQFSGAAEPPMGVVFDVRLGYAAGNTKVPYASIDNATVAWASGYLPVVAIFSNRYHGGDINKLLNSRCGVLTGSAHTDPCRSLFAFCHLVLEYDLEAFLAHYAPSIQREINGVLEHLMNPDEAEQGASDDSLPGPAPDPLAGFVRTG